MNFVTKDEETNLASKEQPEEILNIFKLIHIIVNESYEELKPNELIENLTKNIFTKLNVENLSNYYLKLESLFLNYISRNTNLTDEQFNKMTNLIQENPKLLSSSDLMKINRCVSYLTFILKEINDFTTAKLSDGTPVYKIRQLKNEVKLIEEELAVLKQLVG